MATGDKLVNLDSLKTAYDTAAKITAPMEASSTASAAHATGEYFIYNGILYVATTDIASGATITPNTNCRAVPGGIGGEVSDLKSAIGVSEENALFTFEQGAIRHTDGEDNPTTVVTRIRSDSLSTDHNITLLVNIGASYRYFYYIYVNGSYNRSKSPEEFFTGANKIALEAGESIRFVLSNINGSVAIYPSTVTNFTCKKLSFTDDTLTVVNKAADAKVVGDKISDIELETESEKRAMIRNSNSVVFDGWIQDTGFNIVNGLKNAASGYISNDQYFGLFNNILFVTCDTNHKMFIYAWDSNGTYLGAVKEGNIIENINAHAYKDSGVFYCSDFPNYKFKITIRREPLSTDITTEDGNNIHFHKILANEVSDIKDENQLENLINRHVASPINSNILTQGKANKNRDGQADDWITNWISCKFPIILKNGDTVYFKPGTKCTKTQWLYKPLSGGSYNLGGLVTAETTITAGSDNIIIPMFTSSTDITPDDYDATWTLNNNELILLKYELNESISALSDALDMKLPFPLNGQGEIDYGEDGQVYKSNGDGTAEWTDAASPTDEQIENAVTAWLDDHPEATTTVADNSITPKKLISKFRSEVKSLSDFSGNTDSERLYDALITQNYKGVILGGVITIGSSVTLPEHNGFRDVIIANAYIVLNADLFLASSNSYHLIPNFVNCRFIGNGHSIFNGSYLVASHFTDCNFDNCAMMNNTNGMLQSLYINGGYVVNTSVPFVTSNTLLDCHISHLMCEHQSQTLIKTKNSTDTLGGTRNLWVSDSLFEGFSAPVFDLSGGIIDIRDCYFESNSEKCIVITKNAQGQDSLLFMFSGNKLLTEENSPIQISGFTDNSSVSISIHDNYLMGQHRDSSPINPMISGMVKKSLNSLYNNIVQLGATLSDGFGQIPDHPASDGTYKLTCTVNNGTVVYSWEQAT